MLETIQEYNQMPTMGQVTSVSQLRDVSPTDWAYEALRSLVERYGCIVGYPDRTFRGNRSTSRYEFAAGLNACMQQMERLIAQSEAVLREDIELLQRLMKEFEAELASLGARVDNLEGRVAFLEDHQFSTTTKLRGEVIIAFEAGGGVGPKVDQVYALDSTTPLRGSTSKNLAGSQSQNITNTFVPGTDVLALDAFQRGDITQEEYDRIIANALTANQDDIEEADYQATLSDRVRLTLNTSFTGEDLLRVRLAAGNVADLGDAFGTDQARLNFQQNTDNSVELDRVYYRTNWAAWGGWIG